MEQSREKLCLTQLILHEATQTGREYLDTNLIHTLMVFHATRLTGHEVKSTQDKMSTIYLVQIECFEYV